ncbi:MAG: RNA polymerase-binding transcription factor CarD [Firmicutes bacterium ADurb.Bin182]|nr:MAG: RNA polymerase-binding transcription factor CarD [Firmicutes bacterium ADurb.Bin182]
MFNIGDKICYPMHGVGVVEAIKEQQVLGETARYYVLRFIIGKMTAMVPVNNAEQVGLRHVIPREECERVVKYMSQPSCQESENWNQRYRENLEKLRNGDVYGVADVVKCLNKRESDRGLSAGERKMLATARQVLLAELAASSGEDPQKYMNLVGA